MASERMTDAERIIDGAANAGIRTMIEDGGRYDAITRTQADGAFRAIVVGVNNNETVDVRAQSAGGGERVIRNARPTLGGYPLITGDPVQVWRDTDGAVNCQALDGGYFADGLRDAAFLARVEAIYTVERALPSEDDVKTLTVRMDCRPLKRRGQIHAFATAETVGVGVGSQVWLSRDDGGDVEGVGESYAPRYYAGSGERLPDDYYNGSNPRPVFQLARGYSELAVGVNAALPKERAVNNIIASVATEVDNRSDFVNAPTLQPFSPATIVPAIAGGTPQSESGKLRVTLSERAERTGASLSVSSGVNITPDERSDDDIDARRYVYSVDYATYTTIIYIDAYQRTVDGANRYILIVNRNNPYG